MHQPGQVNCSGLSCRSLTFETNLELQWIIIMHISSTFEIAWSSELQWRRVVQCIYIAEIISSWTIITYMRVLLHDPVWLQCTLQSALLLQLICKDWHELTPEQLTSHVVLFEGQLILFIVPAEHWWRCTFGGTMIMHWVCILCKRMFEYWWYPRVEQLHMQA